MAIRKILDISTAYLSEEEHDDIQAGSVDWIIDPYSYGWRVWVPNNPDDPENEMEAKLGFDGETPCPSLIRLIRYARSQGCDWINFDRDADKDLPPEFRTFEW